VLILVVIGALAIGSFLGWQLYRRHQDDLRLRETIADLDTREPRWRLEGLEADRAFVPDGENSATIIRAAAARIPPSSPEWTELLAEAEPSGPAVALSDRQSRIVIDLFESHESAVAPGLKLEHLPRGRHPITLSADGISTLLRHADDMAQIYYRVIRPLLLLHLHEADGAAAVGDCVSVVNLGRSMGDEPFAVSQMVRQRYVGAAARDVERLLGQLVVSDGDLARLQDIFAEEAARDEWPIIVRGERGTAHQVMVALANGAIKASVVRGRGRNLSPPPPTVIGKILDWLDDRYPPQLSVAHKWVLDETTRLLRQTVHLSWHERTPAVAAICAEHANAPDLAYLWFDIDKLLARFQGSHATIRCILVAIAAERHRLRHGTWPATADELVPEFLTDMPLDPFDGKPIRYKRLPDGVVVYSVGAGAAVDDGVISPTWTQPPMGDISVRLWDVNRRRQPPPGEEKQP